MKRLWLQGVKAYVQDMWNIVEFVTTSLYITTFTLKFVSYFLVRSYYNIPHAADMGELQL